MAFDFPSLEWMTAYKEAINSNANYKVSGREWTHGVVAMVVKADANEKLNLKEDVGMWLDVHKGACRECRWISGEEANQASFVVVASYAQWKQVIQGKIDPTKALMQGKLKLTKGHMPTMVRYVNASKDLVESTSMVPTKFRDE